MKKAIVFCSFGVSDARARQACLDASAELIQQHFPAFTVRQAYTSVFIQKRLKAQGIVIDSLPEALDRLQQEGFEQVIIQPSHLTPGEEFDQKVMRAADEAADKFRSLRVSHPVFAAPEDYPRALAAILPELPLASGEQLVLLGHGSPHHHNPVYERLQQEADRQHLPVHVGVLEQSDTPDYGTVRRRLQACEADQVLLAPLLLAGGMHVTSDMAGDAPESWKSRLTADGYTVRTDLRGLGEYPAFRALYLRRLEELLQAEN